MIEKLIGIVKGISSDLKTKIITGDDIVFEERVLLNCFYCPRYNINWTCPPKIPNLDYKKIFSEYENLLVVYYRKDFTGSITDKDREESTNLLHRTLLKMEKFLWESNYPLAVSFIGGSCKLCKVGCISGKCENSQLARIPIEACGINVVKSMKNIGIEILFPPVKFFYRIGILLW